MASALLSAAPVAWCAGATRSESSDAELLQQARERLLKHRRSSGSIIVRDGKGKPVRHAAVKLEQRRHDFLFGANIFLFNHAPSPDLEAAYRERFAALLNYATLGFYWADYERKPGEPRYAYTDQVLEWTAKHGITCKGHPLVWDHPVSSPEWLSDDQATIERLSTARVREIVERYRGRINIWDVVNEATHLAERKNKTRMAQWGEALGAVQYITRPLRAARAANPAAKLVVNDYRADEAFYKILEQVASSGPHMFDAIGIQSHMRGGLWPLAKFQKICATFGRLGLPLHFTESTLISGPPKARAAAWPPTNAEGEARQADQVEKLYTMLFGSSEVEAITWWDFSDMGAWEGTPAGWLRADMTPKPAYERLYSLIKKAWWTNHEGMTDEHGVVPVTAFFGDYRVSVTFPDGKVHCADVHWQKGRENRFEVVR